MSCQPSTSTSTNDLRAALAELDPAYSELYALHAFEHLSEEQIAERLSIHQEIVGPLLGRVRKKLREVIAQRSGERGLS